MDQILKWAQANSLWYYPLTSACCANELFQSLGCRYDLERFGLKPQSDPSRADLLFVPGLVTEKLKPYLKEVYESMLAPKYVIALGTCANSADSAGAVSNVIPVDVYVPGCPPRPEAIMNGVITLQQRIVSPKHERKVFE